MDRPNEKARQELAELIQLNGTEAMFGINPAHLPAGLPDEVMGAFIMLGVAQQFIDTIDEWVDQTLEAL